MGILVETSNSLRLKEVWSSKSKGGHSGQGKLKRSVQLARAQGTAELFLQTVKEIKDERKYLTIFAGEQLV